MWLIALVLLALAAYFIVRLLLPKNEISDISSEVSTGGGTSGGATPGDDASLPGASNIDEATHNANVHGEPDGNPGETPAVGATEAATTGDTATDAATGGVTTVAAASPATTSATESSAAAPAVNSGNHILDIQDMLKILNLRDSDANRLAISREQYNSLKTRNAGDLNSEQVQGVLSRLQQMMD